MESSISTEVLKKVGMHKGNKWDYYILSLIA